MTELMNCQYTPLRVSIMTYNVWGTNLWPQRRPALSSLISSSKPDVLMLQEATPEILSCLDSALP